MHPSYSSAARRSSSAAAAVIFVVCTILATAVIWYSEKSRIEHERNRASNLAGEHALALQMSIENALSATYALATMIELNRGDMRDFDTAALALRAFYPSIAALELAPGGVVTHVWPLRGNEKAVGHNLLTDPDRDKEAFRARDTGKLTLAGPFRLLQGGVGAAGRLPVYLKDEKGQKQFWGFVVVLIRFPEILAPARLPALVERGYDYEIWRIRPDSGQKHVIASSSDAALSDPVDRTLQVPNGTWTLSIAPRAGWIDPGALAIKIAIALVIVILATAVRYRSLAK